MQSLAETMHCEHFALYRMKTWALDKALIFKMTNDFKRLNTSL